MHAYNRMDSQTRYETITIAIIYLMFLLLPWYHNRSGTLQYVDVVILMVGFLIYQHKICINILLFTSRSYLLLVMLMSYATIRYTIASVQDTQAVHEIFVNLYCLLQITIFLNIIFYLYDQKSEQLFYQTLLYCLFALTVLPLFTLLVYGYLYGQELLPLNNPNIGRARLTFNNANQLGFYAFCGISILYYLNLFAYDLQLKINKTVSLLLNNIFLLFIYLSGTRAVLPGILLYTLSYPIIFQFKLKKQRSMFFWMLFLIPALMFAILLSYIFLQSIVSMRASNIPVPNLTTDINVRMIEGLQYNLHSLSSFLFGLGSFLNPMRLSRLEYHNNVLSLFNQIGLIGVLLYVWLIIELFKGLFKKGVLYVMPFLCYLFYSNLHYAFRTRMNWLFFAVIIFILIRENNVFYKRNSMT